MFSTRADGNGLAHLLARLPAELAPLARLAFNYAWSWHPDGEALFRELDPELWASCGGNPVRLLLESSRLERARTSDIPERAKAALAQIEAQLALASAPAGPATAERPIAYFCAEFGIHGSLPLYAGGLGVLAGDFLKEASDSRLPVVGVGLFYHRGYFHQRLDLTGLQHEYWMPVQHEQLAMRLVRASDGAPLTVKVELRGRDVAFRIWRVDVGRVPLFLLDSDLPDNGPIERFVTGQVYVADREVRLMQYAALGIGGVRALSALGITPALYHLNEGHAALAVLELARTRRAAHATLADTVAELRPQIVFTTHTPVPAGNETYDPKALLRVLSELPGSLGASEQELLALGRRPDVATDAAFGMTELALHASGSTNGVSEQHGKVARTMWRGLYPNTRVEDVPISHVTNGVHLATWMAAPMRQLLRRYLGEDWESAHADPGRWTKVHEIPDEELWQVRLELRSRLISAVRVRSVADRLDRGELIDYVEAAAKSFDASTITVGFARRVATYKRLHLLTESPDRALGLLSSARPIQVVLAGKAHPADSSAKHCVQTVFAIKRAPVVGGRVAYLEDYDLELARTIVAGCDVWVNLPRPPNEASGTSGMKNALNGGLNLSVLDGWWCEGFAGTNGWAIESNQNADPDAQDRADAARLYDLLEQQITPAFYERDAHGLPRRWLQQVKNSLASLGPRFNTRRMLNDYAAHVYAR